jgi:phospholipid/cholesterol/gamma-HCH transport system permease protein
MGFGISVLLHGSNPITWRRTVREEFIEQCHRAGVKALPSITVTGALVGIAMVFQFVYWLSIFGQEDIVGTAIVLVVIREIAPLLVGLIVVGRSGIVMAVELGNMRSSGQTRVLKSQGIDPFLYLIVPRVLALSLCVFCLTITFIVVSLSAGYTMANVVGASNESPLQFINGVLGAMGPSDYVLIPVKTILIGFFIGLVTCTTPLASTRSEPNVTDLLPRTFMGSMLAILVISGTLTLLL